jgi:hypothetical protein
MMHPSNRQQANGSETTNTRSETTTPLQQAPI